MANFALLLHSKKDPAKAGPFRGCSHTSDRVKVNWVKPSSLVTVISSL